MYIDLTHYIDKNISVFPGTEKPIIIEKNTLKKDGFREKLLTFYSHTGTHVDAPFHMIDKGKKLDQYNIEYFQGKGGVIDLFDFDEFLKNKSLLERIDYILVYTGWSKYWKTEKYTDDFPTLKLNQIEKLMKYNIKGIGLDTISIDKIDSKNFENHFKVFEKEMIIIENLTNLDKVINKVFDISIMPMKIRNADGAPARVMISL